MRTEKADEDVAGWLASALGDTRGHVLAELELGERRRAFVLSELADAGYEGLELVALLMRLTGIDMDAARALAERSKPETPRPRARDAALAENEVRFRRHNEEIADLARRTEPPRTITLVCECSDSSCSRALTMPYAEYEWLRQDPVRFVVLPGHEAPAIEDAIERHSGYVIVAKHAESRPLVAAADPRA